MRRYPDKPAPCLIGKTADPFGALSNMSAHPIEFDGARWPRAEQAFQAQRFAPDDPIRDELRSTANPMAAKIKAKQAADRMVYAPRSETDLMVMVSIIRAKHSQHAAVRDVLESTRGRNIIEDCSRRASESGLFWGCRRVVNLETELREKIEGQRTYLVQLGPRQTEAQIGALLGMEAELARRTETYWEGHNWLGRLWMKLREDEPTAGSITYVRDTL